MTSIAPPVPESTPAARGGTVPAQRPGSGAPPRSMWFDVLRAAALCRVVLYHFFGWALLADAFPSMGLMFAMAGSLMARSLTRQKGQHYRVIARRLRRFIPPLWLMGLLVVPLMLWHGWTATTPMSARFGWQNAWLWILPVSTPPGSDWGLDWVVPLWYIRTYLWFVVLSPPTLWLWRRWPRKVFTVAPLLLALMISGILQVAASVGDVVLDLATFGSCWLLGYAHHDGHLRAMPWRQVLPLGSALVAGGLLWAVMHPADTGSWDVNEIPIALAMFSIGGAVLLLRLDPRLAALSRHRVVAGLVSVMSSRALTIYLWNNVAIWAALWVTDRWQVTQAWSDDGGLGKFLIFTTGCLLLTVMVLAFGWVEDLAARRRVQLLPWPSRVPGQSPAAEVPAPTVPAAAAGTAACILHASAAHGVDLGRRRRWLRPCDLGRSLAGGDRGRWHCPPDHPATALVGVDLAPAEGPDPRSRSRYGEITAAGRSTRETADGRGRCRVRRRDR